MDMKYEKTKRLCNKQKCADGINYEHSGLLQTIKQIEELYKKSNEENFCGEHTEKLDRLLNSLPYDVWVQ